MFHLVKRALAGRRRGLLIGIVAAGAAATAAGAAPASFTPWATHTADVVISQDTTTTSVPATTTTHELSTTTTHAPEPTVPATTVHKPEPTTTTHAPEPAPAPVEPSTTTAPRVSEPAPTTTEVHTPATLELSCTLIGDAHNQVTCEWTGPIPDGFVRFLLLRGNQTAKGRVPFNSTEATAHTFTDEPLPAGSYSYVVVIIGSTGVSIAHSNLVPIVIASAG